MNPITACCFGDPLDPKVWSSTPYNICQEFKSRNLLESTVDGGEHYNRWIRKAIVTLSKIYYRIDAGMSIHSSFEREFRGRHVEKKIKNHLNVFHFGTLHLPLKHYSCNQKHYLFIDSTYHFSLTHSTEQQSISSKLLNYINSCEPLIYRSMDHIFVTGDFLKRDLTENYAISENTITAIGTGTGKIAPYHGVKNYFNGEILFVAKGRFEDKGGPEVLAGFQIARQLLPHLKLTIVGQENYKSLAINQPNVFVRGFVSSEELQLFFNNASLFLMPAKYEPWGLVYLEALSCRVPIVGLDQFGFPEFTSNGKYGFGIQKSDPIEISQAIISAFNNPNNLSIMGMEGQNYCLRKYTWMNSVDQIIAAIGEGPC